MERNAIRVSFNYSYLSSMKIDSTNDYKREQPKKTFSATKVFIID